MFLVGHSFGVFQYFFGQLAVGIVMGLFFVVGVALLLRGKGLRPRLELLPRRFGIFLLLPFAIAGSASLAHVYPYGGTRHVAFLIIPAVAGVSVALARARRRQMGSRHSPSQPSSSRPASLSANRASPAWTAPIKAGTHMAAAIDFVRTNEALRISSSPITRATLFSVTICASSVPFSFDPAPGTSNNFPAAATTSFPATTKPPGCSGQTISPRMAALRAILQSQAGGHRLDFSGRMGSRSSRRLAEALRGVPRPALRVVRQEHQNLQDDGRPTHARHSVTKADVLSARA